MPTGEHTTTSQEPVTPMFLVGAVVYQPQCASQVLYSSEVADG